MENYEALRERSPYPRDIYHELQRIEQRGRRLKESKKQKRAALLRFLGRKSNTSAETA